MTDAELNRLMGQVAMQIRRETVDSLLAGNDLCCCSTQQYLDRYIRDHVKSRITMMDLPLARMHLISLRMTEVKPDVWTEPKPKE